MAIAALVALVILGTSFPFSALLSQRHRLASVDAQLVQVQHQNAVLSREARQLSSNAAIRQLGRQEFQLVLPGQSLYGVLPAAGEVPAAGKALPGDPATSPLVSPANVAGISSTSSSPVSASAAVGNSAAIPRTSTSKGTGAGASGGGFWHRVATTLEFWR